MASRINVGGVHHLRLTVTDVERARTFYTEVLGFDVAMELSPGVLLTNGQLILGLGPAPDPNSPNAGARFDESHVGLDHLSFSVNSRDDLEEAIRILDENNVEHGEIKDLDLRIYILAFRDPDNIQLELTAPYS